MDTLAARTFCDGLRCTLRWLNLGGSGQPHSRLVIWRADEFDTGGFEGSLQIKQRVRTPGWNAFLLFQPEDRCDSHAGSIRQILSGPA
jgi:hypothetical protein